METDNPVANIAALIVPDVLDRRSIADNLTAFISTLNEPTVLCINAPWGAGKTTFITLWKTLLEAETPGYTCFYFNAWINDFSTNVIIPFIAEFEEFQEEKLSKDSVSQERMARLKKASAKIARGMLPVILRIITRGALKDVDEASELFNLDEDAADNIAEALGDATKSSFEQYKQQKESISEFRKVLEQFIGTMRVDNSRPVIFFIDELDRCRPTFAVELLETIKHLFNVPGLIFVLALDAVQLSHSVRALYGNEFDARGYLRRFLDYDFHLPDPAPDVYIKHLYKTYGISDIITARNLWGHVRREIELVVTEVLADCVRRFRMSLRDQQQCFRELSILVRIAERNTIGYLDYAAFIIVWKRVASDLLSAFNRGEADVERVMSVICQGSDSQSLNDVYIEFQAILMRAHKDRNAAYRLNKNYQEKRKEDNNDSVAAHRVEVISEMLRRMDFDDPHVEIVKALGFASKFDKRAFEGSGDEARA